MAAVPAMSLKMFLPMGEETPDGISTINIHIGSHRLADNPSNKKVVSSPYSSRFLAETSNMLHIQQ
jgi:hypothetical protein